LLEDVGDPKIPTDSLRAAPGLFRREDTAPCFEGDELTTETVDERALPLGPDDGDGELSALSVVCVECRRICDGSLYDLVEEVTELEIDGRGEPTSARTVFGREGERGTVSRAPDRCAKIAEAESGGSESCCWLWS
jgi:hypothetical protein